DIRTSHPFHEPDSLRRRSRPMVTIALPLLVLLVLAPVLFLVAALCSVGLARRRYVACIEEEERRSTRAEETERPVEPGPPRTIVLGPHDRMVDRRGGGRPSRPDQAESRRRALR